MDNYKDAVPTPISLVPPQPGDKTIEIQGETKWYGKRTIAWVDADDVDYDECRATAQKLVDAYNAMDA